MKKNWSTVYAISCTLLLAAGFVSVFYFAWQKDVGCMIECLCGLAIGFIFAPIVHELGHVFFAARAGMETLYVKCFCFAFERACDGKMKFSFRSPFLDDCTQVTPKFGGDMQKRACAYTLGGLTFSGVFLLLIAVAAIILSALGVDFYLLWGSLPYAAYLFLLNVVPAEYASGKTDALVFSGLKKGCDAEKNMLTAMEIQGRLYAGNSFAEIPETLYYDAPQLCEDEPLFAMTFDLRYRYHLEKGELEKAADCLNRLAQSQAYLSDKELEKVAAELTYMHSLNKDLPAAEETGKLCQDFLRQENVTAKRVLAAFSAAFAKKDAVAILLEQAQALLPCERLLGVRKFEEVLLSRIEKV